MRSRFFPKRILFFIILFSAHLSLAADSGQVVIYGDCRTGHEAHGKIVSAVLKVNPGLVFIAGDLVENGLNKAEWDTFNQITTGLSGSAQIYPALGNHENNSPLYFDNFKLPGDKRWYSLDYQGCHFVILDSTSPLSLESEQCRWLEDDLSRSGKVRKIVIMHHPIFSVGSHGENAVLKTSLLPLFEKYGVSAVFAGHEHNYQRFSYKRIYYIVTGGGGAPLHDKNGNSPYLQKFRKEYHFCALSIKDKSIKVKVFNQDLKLIDQFEIVR